MPLPVSSENPEFMNHSNSKPAAPTSSHHSDAYNHLLEQRGNSEFSPYKDVNKNLMSP